MGGLTGWFRAAPHRFGTAVMAIVSWVISHGIPRILGLAASAVLPIALILTLFMPPDGREHRAALVPVRLNVSELSSVAVLRPNREVTLVIERTDRARLVEEFTDLQVAGLFAEDGRSVGYSSEQPESILLGVPPSKLDALREALAVKKSAYLKPEALGVTATSTPAPTPTPGPALPPVDLRLPREVIRSSIPDVGTDVVVVLVAAQRSTEGDVLQRSHLHFDAQLVQIDGSGDAWVRLARRASDGTAFEIAKQLADTDMIILLASPPLDAIVSAATSVNP
ncbi:MAG: hypothetical protein ACKVVP_09645 [Chloroflexota bacterium]